MPMRRLPRSPLRELAQPFLGQLQLRQHAAGQLQQVAAGLRQAQAAALAQPDGVPSCCSSFFMLLWLRADWVTYSLSAAAVMSLALDLLDHGEMDAVQHFK